MQAEEWLDMPMLPFPPPEEHSYSQPMSPLPWLFIASRYQVPPAVAAEVQSFLLVAQCVLGGHSAELINACCVVPAAGGPTWGSLRQAGICQEEVIHPSPARTVSLGSCRLLQTQERKIVWVLAYPESCPHAPPPSHLWGCLHHTRQRSKEQQLSSRVLTSPFTKDHEQP